MKAGAPKSNRDKHSPKTDARRSVAVGPGGAGRGGVERVAADTGPGAGVNSDPMRGNRLRTGWFALVMLAVFLVYFPAWNGKQLWDDDSHITRPQLRSWEGLGRIWLDPASTQQYYPLVHSVFWLEYKLWGEWTLPYHLVNLALHTTAALLVLVILRRLKIPGAWLAATIFALHPVQVETAAWISELKNTLSGVLYLGAALLFLKYDEDRSRRNYAIGFGLFFLGLMCKTVIATLPAALLVVWWWQRGKLRWRQDVLPMIPLFAIGMAAGLFTAWVERHLVGAQGKSFQFTMADRLLIAGRAFWFYVGKIFWPADLIFSYPRWEIEPSAAWQYAYPAAAFGAAAGLWWFRQRDRGPLAAVLFFGGTLFPALGFFNVYPFRFSFVADHFQYLACIGPITVASACLAMALRRWPEWERPLGSLAYAVLAGVLSYLTWCQSALYVNAETLWKDTLSKNPSSWLAHDNYAAMMVQTGRPELAIEHFSRSIEINPDSVYAHNGLALALISVGRSDEAIGQLQKAVEMQPADVGPLLNLAMLLWQKGRSQEAIVQFQKFLESQPTNAFARTKLGDAFLATGRWTDAATQFQKALELDPANEESMARLGDLLLRSGQLDAAISRYESALRIKPADADVHTSLANALRLRGNLDEAIVHYQRSVDLVPGNALVHANFGTTLVLQHRWVEALSQLQEAARLAPANARILNDLSSLLATVPDPSLRNGAKAISLAQRADQLTGGKDPQVLSTLAAAYAESEQWDNAAAAAERGEVLAANQGKSELETFLRKQIEAYRAKAPPGRVPKSDGSP